MSPMTDAAASSNDAPSPIRSETDALPEPGAARIARPLVTSMKLKTLIDGAPSALRTELGPYAEVTS